MARDMVCRLPGVIRISRDTGERTMEWEDVPASVAEACLGRLTRAYEMTLDMDRRSGEEPEKDKGGEKNVQV